MRPIDETHDARLKSWVPAANSGDTDFPIQNLPFGVFQQSKAAPRIGTAIGDQILDLTSCEEMGLLDGLPAALQFAIRAPTLNPLMALGREAMAQLRPRLTKILSADGPVADPDILVPMNEAELLPPAVIGDYTDFYSSIYHATNVGRLFRPDNPLLPNYKHLPIAYHGRSSSIVVSGSAILRPSGQVKPAGATGPAFVPSQRLDYELEMAGFVGTPNTLGDPIVLDGAEDHLFGLALLNDWSARDVQAWEYQPLGPFLAKNFATTIAPWVVTVEALAPFRCPAFRRDPDDPPLLPYLRSADNDAFGGFDITAEIFFRSARMRAEGLNPVRVSRTSVRYLYWTFAQMVAHHTSNGCNLRTGDVLGSGTVSGPQPDSVGSLLELTRQGAEPVTLPTGETRPFLADGDEVIFRAFCERDGFARIGFGECRGTIVGHPRPEPKDQRRGRRAR